MPIHSNRAHGYVRFTLSPAPAGTTPVDWGKQVAREIRKDDIDHPDPNGLNVATVSFVEKVDAQGNAAGGHEVSVYIECPTHNRTNEMRNLENWARAVEGRLNTQLASHVTFCCISDQ